MSTRRGAQLGRILAALPPVVLIGMVVGYGVDLPFWDQWDLVPLLADLDDGSVELADVWRQHNEHRLFFPRLAMLALAAASDWNVRWELALNVLIAVGIFVAAVSLLRSTDSSSRAGWAALPLISLLVWSPSQWENWAWGWQIATFANVLGALAGFGVLARDDGHGYGRLALAAGCGVLASYSFATGLLFWPLALPLVLAPARRRAARAVAWMVVTASAVGLYFWGFALGTSLGEWDLTRLKLFAGYVSVYIGAPAAAYDGRTAMYGGFVALVAVAGWAVWRWRRGTLGRNELPWLVVAGYAVASAALTGLGRLDFGGIGQGFSSRYVTIGNLFWLATVGLVASTPAVVPALRRARVAAAVALAATLLAGAWTGVGRLAAEHFDRSRLRAELRRGAELGDGDLERLYPDATVVRQRLEVLRRQRLSLFRKD